MRSKTSGINPIHPPTASTIWTIGHSTRELSAFLDLLDEFRIEVIADVRRFPGSKSYPHYGSAALAASLAQRGLDYQWFEVLGGRRRAAADSPNVTWRNPSFRGYADYMSSPEFVEGLHELIGLAGKRRTALMCAEAVWWRCHRSMVADALCVRGFAVVHIMGAGHGVPHPMTSPARVVDGVLSYAPPV